MGTPSQGVTIEVDARGGGPPIPTGFQLEWVRVVTDELNCRGWIKKGKEKYLNLVCSGTIPRDTPAGFIRYSHQVLGCRLPSNYRNYPGNYSTTGNLTGNLQKRGNAS